MRLSLYATGLASLLFMALLAGAQTRPAEPAAGPAIEPLSLHAAVLQMDPPAGTPDDAAWQRQIATCAAKIRLRGPVEALRTKLQADKAKIRPELLDSPEALAAAIRVRLFPGTSVFEVWADVSADPQVCAAKTNDLVQAFVDQQADEVRTIQAKHIEQARTALTVLREQYTLQRASVDDYRSAHGTDTALPATAPADAQVDRTRVLRELKEREDDLAATRSQLAEMRRHVFNLQLATVADAVPLRVVQPAK